MSAEIEGLSPVAKEQGRELFPTQPEYASSDDHLLQLWLHGRSLHTQRAYRADVERFRIGAGKPLASMTLAFLEPFAAIRCFLCAKEENR